MISQRFAQNLQSRAFWLGLPTAVHVRDISGCWNALPVGRALPTLEFWALGVLLNKLCVILYLLYRTPCLQKSSMLFRKSLSLSIALPFVALAAKQAKQLLCFLPDGSTDSNDIPCFSDDNLSRCCAPDEL
jgi:hypothetical protein